MLSRIMDKEYHRILLTCVDEALGDDIGSVVTTGGTDFGPEV